MFQALSRYGQFEGRAGRKEYWYFVLLTTIASIVGAIVDGVSFHQQPSLELLLGAALLIPTLSVSVRRLHDTDRGAAWLLIAVIPLIGAVVLLAFAAQPGGLGPNRFGDPVGG